MSCVPVRVCAPPVVLHALELCPQRRHEDGEEARRFLCRLSEHALIDGQELDVWVLQESLDLRRPEN